MIDKLFELFSDTKNVSYYYETTIYTPTEGFKRYVKTNVPSLKEYKSEQTLGLEKAINEKRAELAKLISAENFEDAIVLRDELKNLAVQLESAVQSDREEAEKRKSSQEILNDLQKKLSATVQSENYEEAARIRDEIKQLKEKIE